MEAPFWSAVSRQSGIMHLFPYGLASADGKMRAKCGRHAKPIGRKKKNDPDRAMRCDSCNYNRYAQQMREAKQYR